MRVAMFATPVFFEPQMLGPRYAPMLMAMPLSPFIQGIELAFIRHHNLLQPLTMPSSKGPVSVWEPWMLLYAATSTLVLLMGGLLLFRSASSRFAEMA